MVRNIVILSGNSHPALTDAVCHILGVPPGNRILTKFSAGESRCEIQDSVRGKDVFIIQSGGGSVNDHFMELCIMISACKTGSAKRVTAILPLFPYSRQPDLPYKKSGAPLSKDSKSTLNSVTATPAPGIVKTPSFNKEVDLTKALSKSSLSDGNGAGPSRPNANGDYFVTNGTNGDHSVARPGLSTMHAQSFTTHDLEGPALVSTFEAKPGYKRWVAQAGTLVADLLTCAGADHVVAMDLHDPQYQGFFDIPMDNLYGRPLLKRYIQQNIPDYKDAVIVSPDAGGAKRATAIADSLGTEFALIHKERRPIRITDRQSSTMMLVGNVANRVCILIDDLADTAQTITRAAKLLRKERATKVYALLTHGVFNGDAIQRINNSTLDKIVVTNSVPQDENRKLCPKLEVLDVAPVFAEAIRRIHHGESISVLFHYD
ncbi:Uu.00g126420.m01.CDS01 [Anthostomella pinea]|uniref:Uu.00g126420.m01.CDS01 n=1 Tax=Anthostomella pinea TaxID=933095 RepID=A0AAI8YFD4_9PEZI|nr:Uu.00g126420.m01.CDS01 [Anthostomella pinea]